MTIKTHLSRGAILVLIVVASISGVGVNPPFLSEAQDGMLMTYGASTFGAVMPGAPVTYTFSGMAGDLVQLDAHSVSPNLYPRVELIGPDQRMLADEHDNRLALRSTDAHLAAFLPQSGVYTIQISGMDGSTGEFVLRLFGRGAMPNVTLQYGEAVDVNIVENDEPKTYSFDAADCPTTLIVSSRSEGEPFTFRYVVKVRNQDGREIALLRGGYAQEDRVTVPALSGRYEIEIFADEPALAGLISLLITCAEDAPGCTQIAGDGTSDTRDPSCPPCPTCPGTPGSFDPGDHSTTTCPDMGLTATVIDPEVRGTVLTWNPVPGIDHYNIHIFGSGGDGEHYLGAAGAPPDATEFVFDHLFPGFDGYRFLIEAIDADLPICTDETILPFLDVVQVCSPTNLRGEVTDHAERWAHWTWNAFPGASGYAMSLEALLADGSTVLVGSATFGAETTAWDTNHPLDLVSSDTFRVRMQVIVGDMLICPDEATIVFEREPAEPCEIVAERADVQVHVGPGRHRGVFAYLESGRGYRVTGQATDPDGNLWWQIDKTQIPGHDMVTSLWVAESDVIERGLCTDIPSAEIPNIVPDDPGIPGSWGPCGSCDTCGHPGECVTAPDGQCLWDPATCAGQGPPPPDGTNGTGDNEPPPAQEPQCVFVTASVSPANTGSAGPITHGNCVSEIPGIYTPGTVAQVQAWPNAGCWLDHWSGCGAGGAANPVTITVNATCHIVATIQCMQ